MAYKYTPTATPQRPLALTRDKSRILIVGYANAGKTSILQRVADTTQSPVVFQGTEAVQLSPSLKRGGRNIDDEFMFSNYARYIFHNSRGFEAGSDKELKIVQEFVQQRAGQKRPQDRLHAIWYCVPMDHSHPELDLKYFKDICPDRSVPVIVVFTKYDQFLRNVKMNLEDYGNPDDNTISDEAERQFKEHYLCHLSDDVRWVRLGRMHRPQMCCQVLLEVTAEVLSDDAVAVTVLDSETDSFIYNPSFASSDSTIASYKTEKTVNSRKSRYNIAPRRKCPDTGHPRLPPLVSEDVDEASVLASELDDESFLSSNSVEESGQSGVTQSPDQPFEIRGSFIYGSSIVNTASQLERTINHWAVEVLHMTSAPTAALQEAVLTDLTDVGESTALFTDVRPMVVQCLLRHAMSEVISEGIINSLIVSNSLEGNLELTRVHERLLTRDVTAAAVWRRHTFSVAVEHPSPEMIRTIFEQKMPLLAALLPDSAEDALGTRDVLEDAFKFSCMLRGTGPDADALYRSFVPKLGSTLRLGLVELVKPCRRGERGEVDRVGATVFPGLFEVLPTPPMMQTVVRRAQVICECELLTTSSSKRSSSV